MNNQEIAINTSTLNGDINELKQSLSNARKQMGYMFDHVAELDSMWDGPANEAFKSQFNADYENMESLFKTVESLIECMEFAKKQYDLCENEVSDIVNSISI